VGDTDLRRGFGYPRVPIRRCELITTPLGAAAGSGVPPTLVVDRQRNTRPTVLMVCGVSGSGGSRNVGTQVAAAGEP
jgi:hypothetical protein